jgi:hypothetical protein
VADHATYSDCHLRLQAVARRRRIGAWLTTAAYRLINVAHRISYGKRRQCQTCKAYSAGTGPQAHSIDCPVPRSEEDWKKVAMEYYEAWLRDYKHERAYVTATRARAELWQAKYHALRLENNALRKRVHKRRSERSPEYQAATDALADAAFRWWVTSVGPLPHGTPFAVAVTNFLAAGAKHDAARAGGD